MPTVSLEAVLARWKDSPELQGPLKELQRALRAHERTLTARRGPTLYERVCLGVGAVGLAVCTFSFLYLVLLP